MKIGFGRIILAASAASAVLLTLDKGGVTPIARGHDVRLAWNADGTGTRLNFTTDAGDLECLVRLKLRVAALRQASPRAHLSIGHQLAVAKDSEWLEISEPDKDPSNRAKFHWPSGTRLTVNFDGGASACSLGRLVCVFKRQAIRFVFQSDMAQAVVLDMALPFRTHGFRGGVRGLAGEKGGATVHSRSLLDPTDRPESPGLKGKRKKRQSG